jgi:hypothetical protein
LPGCTSNTGPNPVSLRDFCNSGARVRGKVPIIDLSSLLLVPDNSSCCLPCAQYTRVPIQYPVRDFATAGLLGQGPNQYDLSSLLLVPDNSMLPAWCTLYTGSQSSILLGDFAKRARVRGKVPILTCQACCWSLITAAVACLCTLIHGSQSSILLGIRNSGGSGKVPITDCLLLVPDNSSCCLPVHAYTRVPIQYPVRDFATAGLGLGARSQSILTCQACCWSLITAAVACLVHPVHTGPNPVSC